MAKDDQDLLGLHSPRPQGTDFARQDPGNPVSLGRSEDRQALGLGDRRQVSGLATEQGLLGLSQAPGPPGPRLDPRLDKSQSEQAGADGLGGEVNLRQRRVGIMGQRDVDRPPGLERSLENPLPPGIEVFQIQEDDRPRLLGLRPESRTAGQPLRGPHGHPRIVLDADLFEQAAIVGEDGLLRDRDGVGLGTAAAGSDGVLGKRPPPKPLPELPAVSRLVGERRDLRGLAALSRLLDRLVKHHASRGRRQPQGPILGLAANLPPEIIPAEDPRGPLTPPAPPAKRPLDLVARQRRGHDPEPRRLAAQLGQ